MKSFTAKHRVEFRDTDAAGIMHFSTFMTYMEESEHAFLRSLGLSVLDEEVDGNHLSWPRVSVQCDYQKPLRFEDEFDVQVSINRMGDKSITYQFRFVCGGEAIAKGAITVVCCRLGNDKMESVSIPDELKTKLLPYCEE